MALLSPARASPANACLPAPPPEAARVGALQGGGRCRLAQWALAQKGTCRWGRGRVGGEAAGQPGAKDKARTAALGPARTHTCIAAATTGQGHC